MKLFSHTFFSDTPNAWSMPLPLLGGGMDQILKVFGRRSGGNCVAAMVHCLPPDTN